MKRNATKEGDFIHVPTGAYDRDLFAIVWGPTVAALSFVFDKSSDDVIIQRAVSGFRYVCHNRNETKTLIMLICDMAFNWSFYTQWALTVVTAWNNQLH